MGEDLINHRYVEKNRIRNIAIQQKLNLTLSLQFVTDEREKIAIFINSDFESAVHAVRSRLKITGNLFCQITILFTKAFEGMEYMGL